MAIFRLIGAVGRVSLEEAGKLRNLFLFFFLVPLAVMIVRVISFGSWKITLLVGLGLVVFGIFVLLKLRRLIMLTVVGEVLDFLGATGEAKPGLANVINVTYIRLAYALFVFSMATCFTLPFMPVENFLYFPVIFYSVALIFFGVVPIRLVARVLVVELLVVGSVLVLLSIFAISPQLRVYLHVEEILGLGLTEKQAQGVSELSVAEQQTRDRLIENDLEEVKRWRRDNPTAQAPLYVEKFISNLKIGKKKTLAEVKEELQNGGQKKAAGDSLGKELKEFKELLPKDVSGKDLLLWSCMILAGLAIFWTLVKAPADTRSKGLINLLTVLVWIVVAGFLVIYILNIIDNTVRGSGGSSRRSTVVEAPQREVFAPEWVTSFGVRTVHQSQTSTLIAFGNEVGEVEVVEGITVYSTTQEISGDCGEGSTIHTPQIDGGMLKSRRFLLRNKGRILLPAGTRIKFHPNQEKAIKLVFLEGRTGELVVSGEFDKEKEKIVFVCQEVR